MPHIKLEHTENLASDKIHNVFKELINILIKNALVKKGNCKCKAIQIPVYSIGNNNSDHLYHLEISLLKGRVEEIRKVIGQKSLEILKKYFVDNNGDTRQFSVEIREMSPENYFTSTSL